MWEGGERKVDRVSPAKAQPGGQVVRKLGPYSKRPPADALQVGRRAALEVVRVPRPLGHPVDALRQPFRAGQWSLQVEGSSHPSDFSLGETLLGSPYGRIQGMVCGREIPYHAPLAYV